MRHRLATLLATVLLIGRLRPAPGSWGSAAAIVLAWLLHWAGGFALLAAATALAFVAGWWATAEVTRGRDDHDPSEIVIDELVGMWIALWPLSAGLTHAGVDPWVFPYPGWGLGFVLFRLFDIWKPGPVGRADRREDALGVMLDDVIAGVMAGVIVLIAGGLAHWGAAIWEYLLWIF